MKKRRKKVVVRKIRKVRKLRVKDKRKMSRSNK